MSRHPSKGQVPLFVVDAPAPRPEAPAGPRSLRPIGARRPPGAPAPDSGRFGLATEEEAATLGRALLAEMREEPLTLAQRALLAEARAEAEADLRAPTPVVEQAETLLTLPRGDHAELRISLRRYKGSSPFLDLRRWEETPDGLRPTRQGVTIRAREVAEVLGALAKAARRFAGGDA